MELEQSVEPQGDRDSYLEESIGEPSTKPGRTIKSAQRIQEI